MAFGTDEDDYLLIDLLIIHCVSMASHSFIVSGCELDLSAVQAELFRS